MSNFDETVIRRLTALEREVERLRVWERPAGGSGVTDHGALTGLADNDHPQYLLTTGKAADSDKLDGIDSTGFATASHIHNHGALTGLGDNDHPQYRLVADAIDHGALTGLEDNDHPQYRLVADAIDHGALTGLEDNDHPQYQLKDGWIPVSDTWTYKTATTITVPSGAASIYKVGMGIRLTQTTVKYFYIVGVTDTVLTVTGGSDYTLANATISAVSYTNTPSTAIGFPDIFNYTPVVTYLGGTTNPTGWTNLTAQFSINGRTATVRINGQLNRGSGDRNYVLFSEPVACANVSAGSCFHELVNYIPVAGVNWADGSTINVYLGGAMNYNGNLFININYQI